MKLIDWLRTTRLTPEEIIEGVLSYQALPIVRQKVNSSQQLDLQLELPLSEAMS
jgi:hypothetical protein